MSTITERLSPGLAADEARLPEEARFREEGRGVRFDECDSRGQMRSAALLRHAQDLAWRQALLRAVAGRHKAGQRPAAGRSRSRSRSRWHSCT